MCRAWHVACEVKVLAPGIGEAEGKRKGNCVIARWGGEEVQRKSTGRRTETGYKVWYTRDQRARDREVLHSPNGVCFINPAFTCGRLRVLPREACKASERTERGESKPIALQESAEGIVVDETSWGPVMARLNRDTRRLTSTKARTVYRGLGARRRATKPIGCDSDRSCDVKGTTSSRHSPASTAG